MDVRKEARRRARKLREEFRARGEFTQSAFREELAEVLRPLDDGAFDAFVDKIADDVDRDSYADHHPDQLDLPGFDLDGEYRCGGNVRIAKRLATRDHAERALMIDDQNLIAVQRANLRKREEMIKLGPFWIQSTRKEDALAAYLRAHPDENVG